jgi:UDP-N-acetylmuramoylalanine--D-glutamate ligase
MRLVILGGGESGVGTAILGKKKDMKFCIWFRKDKGIIKVLIINGIAWEEEKHTEDLILNADGYEKPWYSR